MTDDYEIIESIAKSALEDDPEQRPHALLRLGDLIAKIPGPWCRPLYACLHNSRIIVGPHQVAIVLVRHVAKGERSRDILSKLAVVLATSGAGGVLCTGLVGPVVQADAELAPGLVIGSASTFPNHGSPPWLSLDDLMHPVTSCIRIRQRNEPVFTTNLDLPHAAGEDRDAAYTTLSEVESLLVLLACPTPVTSAGTCFAYDDADIDALSHSSSMRTMDGQVFRRPLRPTKDIDGANLVTLWKNWGRISTGDRQKLLLACDRINRSLLQVRPIDRGIEACTALEILFGQGKSDSVTHKIATRCARYLHSAIDARAESWRFIKKMYGIRSDGLHAGKSSGQLPPSDLDLLSKTAAQAALKMVTDGAVPSESHLDFS